MADKRSSEHRRDPVPTEKKLDDLYDLIEGIGTAMFTTRRADGHLVSRPMATQEHTRGVDLWFVTNIQTHKLDDLMIDPHVNVAYYKDRTREWVSVAGLATVSTDRELIDALYSHRWKPWFPDEGGTRDGGPDDPRIALILVEAESVTYMKEDRPAPVVLFEVAKAMVTGDTPDVSPPRTVGERELHRDVGSDLRGL